MYSVHDRVIVDNMSEFEHSSSRATCTFSMEDSRVKRLSTTGHKTHQARLPADYGLHKSTFPSLVNCILTIPEFRRQNFLLLVALLIALALQNCCHDPFIVRSASNSSTVPRFHSVYASVSMFAITDNCLFLFLFLFLGRFLNTTRASVQPSIPLHLHRSKPLHVHTYSVYVRTTSADFAPDPSSACFHHLVDPWPAEYQSYNLNNIVVQKQRLALFSAYCCNICALLFLFVSNLFQYPESLETRRKRRRQERSREGRRVQRENEKRR